MDDGDNRLTLTRQRHGQVSVSCCQNVEQFDRRFDSQRSLAAICLWLQGDRCGMDAAECGYLVVFQPCFLDDAAGGDARTPVPAENIRRLTQKSPALVTTIRAAIAGLCADQKIDFGQVGIRDIFQTGRQADQELVVAVVKQFADVAAERIMRAGLMADPGTIQKNVGMDIERFKNKLNRVAF